MEEFIFKLILAISAALIFFGGFKITLWLMRRIIPEKISTWRGNLTKIAFCLTILLFAVPFIIEYLGITLHITTLLIVVPAISFIYFFLFIPIFLFAGIYNLSYKLLNLYLGERYPSERSKFIMKIVSLIIATPVPVFLILIMFAGLLFGSDD